MGSPRELDHWLGERHGPSYPRLLYRLHMVWNFLGTLSTHGYALTVVHPSPYGSAQMITTALNVGSDGAINLGAGPTFGILIAILFTHAMVCSAATAVLARLNIFYVVVNGRPALFTSRLLAPSRCGIGL